MVLAIFTFLVLLSYNGLKRILKFFLILPKRASAVHSYVQKKLFRVGSVKFIAGNGSFTLWQVKFINRMYSGNRIVIVGQLKF